MQMKSIKQQKITNIMKNLFLFVYLIGFVTSTPNTTNINSNLNGDIILKKFNSGDLSVLANENNVLILRYMIENEKNEIIKKKSFKDFKKTFIFKFINTIKYKFISRDFEILIEKEINRMLEICIENIDELSKLNIYNNTYYNYTICQMTFLYCKNRYNSINFECFNKKIIPIIYKILDKEILEFNDNLNVLTKTNSIINKIHNKEKYGQINFINNSPRRKFLEDCIYIFSRFNRSDIFYMNLADNIKLKEVFINIIDEYITFLIIENDYFKSSIFIDNFFNNFVLEFIENNSSCMKVFLKLIDHYFQNFKENLLFYKETNFIFTFIKIFLTKYLQNTINYIKKKDLDTLSNIFNNIVDIEIRKYSNFYSVSLYTIEIYTDYIVTIPKENIEKNIEIIEIFEKNVNKFIKLINVFEIDVKNYNYNNNSYFRIKNYLYDSDINFENNKFNNPILITNIKNSFYEYITKIIIFELKKISFNVKEFHKNYILYQFLSLSHIELRKYNFKTIISNDVLKKLDKFNKTFINLEPSENINLTTIDRNLLEFAFSYELINMDEIDNRNLVLKFLENYINNISKCLYNFKDVEFFIFYTFYIINLIKKLDLDENLKNSYLKNLNKFLEFETEIQEFIDNKNREEVEELFLVKFIDEVKESDLKILYNLEKLNKEI